MPFTWWNRLFPRARSFQRRRWQPLERLEDRTTPAVTAALVAGSLNVGLSAAGDEARLGVAGANLEVRDGTNALILATPAAGVTDLSFLGLSLGNQTVVWNDNVTITGGAALAGISQFTINGTYTIGTTLTATLAGPGGGGISEGAAGQLVVTGLTTLTAPGRDINLPSATIQDFSTISITANNVVVRDINSLDLGTTTTTGTFAITVNGALTDSGPLTIGGDATFTDPNNFAGVTLDNANDFQGLLGGVVIFQLRINDINDLSLGFINAGLTSLIVGGAVIDGNGPSTNISNGAVEFDATTGVGSGDAIETTNVSVAARNTVSGSIEITDSGNLSISAVSTLAGITQSGAGDVRINANGFLRVNAFVFNTSGGDIFLTSVNNGGNNDDITVNFRITASGGNGSITLNSGNDLIINDSAPIDDISTTGTGSINLSAVRNTQINALARVTTAGGPLNITTDDFAIDPTASLTGGIVTITTSTAGRVIDLGTDTAGRLGLTDAELDRITATTLRVGDAATGPIINTAAITAPATYTTLSLITGANVANGGGSITVPNLAIRAATGIGSGAAPLSTAVGTVAAADSASGDIRIANTGALIVGTVDALPGVSLVGAAAGNVVISAASPLTINADVINGVGGDIVLTAANDGGNDDNLTVNARIIAFGGNGSITLNAGTDLILNDSGSNPDISTAGTGAINFNVVRNSLVNANVQVTTAGGPLNITTDDATIAATASLTGGLVTITTTTAGRGIDLGSDTAGQLGLTDAELDRITATRLTIGSATAGAITNSAAISQTGSGYTTLSLISGANVLNGGGSIAGTNLVIRAQTGIGTVGTPLATGLGNLEAITATGGIFIANTGNLAIGGIDAGLNGIRVTAAGNIGITSQGNISVVLAGERVTGPGAITLTASGAAADLSTGGGNGGVNAAVNAGGDVNLTAGRDLLLGGATNLLFGDVRGVNITLNAGRNLTLNGDTFVDATGTLGASAGQDLTVTNVTNGIGPRFTTTGGTIGLTAGGVLTLAASAAIAAVISNGGGITFTADSMTIDRAVNAGAGNVILQQNSAARPLNLGTETAGSLSLTDAELDQITAAAICVGRTTAAVTISAPITLSTNAAPPATGSNTLVILGSTVTETTGSITVNTLGVSATGDVNLDQPNTVTRLGINTTGNVTFRGTTGLTAFTACGINFNGITSNNGDVVITADDLNIAAPINAGNGCVIIQPQTANRPIDIGTETAGSLSLTNTELNFVTARVLRVGSTTAGPISVTQAINLTTTPTLALRSGATVTEAAAGTLTVTNLGVQAGGAITLNNANAVGTLAASAGAAINFVNGPNLTIGSVDVCDPATLDGLTAPNAAINVTVTGAGNLLTINNAINAGNGAIVLTADDMAINAAVNSGNQTTTLIQQTAGRTISLGADFAGSLGLTDAELDRITASQINIGNGASGDVTSRSPISPAGTTTLRIQTGGAIVDANGADPDITVANLALIAVNGIGSADSLDTAVSSLAFTNGSNGVQIANTGNLTIDNVAGVATSTSASTATITALGGITFAVNTTSTGDFSASALETTPPAANVSNIVIDAGVTVQSTAGNATFNAGDRITVNGTAQAALQLTLASAVGDNDADGSQTLNGNLIATTTTLNVNGAGGATQTGGTITSGGLLLLGTGASGSFTLTQAGNNVNVLAAATSGAINYTDFNALTVGNVNGTGGINTGGTNLTLTTGGLLTLGDATANPQPITAAGAIVDLFSAGITQNAIGPLVAGSLRIRGNGAFTLLNPGNDVVTVAADTTGAISFRDANALTIGTVLGTVGVRVQGINANVDALTLFTGTDLTIAQIINTGGIGGGNITANIGQTAVGTLTQNVELSARRANFNGGNAVTPGGVGDTFLIRPSATTPIFVDGNLPTTPIGDSLRLFLNQGELGLQFTPGVPGAGTFTFTNRATITFVEIETLNQLNLLAFVLQTGPNTFTISAQGRIEQQVSGVVPLATIPTNPFVVSPQLVDPIQPFGAPRLAVGDVNGDGIPDLIAAFGPNNAPLVTVFDGADVFRAVANPRILSQFFAYDPRFFGGVFVAAADFNGDGRAEIVTGPDQGGGPHVRVLFFDPNVANINANVGAYPGPLGNFEPFPTNFTGGVRVATGDINGDGTPDLITAAGPGGGPHVRTFDGSTGQQLAGPLGSFFPYEDAFRGGVFVAAGDYNSDGFADIMTGPGIGGSARVRIFSGANAAVLADFNAFPPPGPNFPYPPTGGGTITPFPNETIAFNGVGGLAFADLDGDNNLDILVGSGRGQAARMRGFRGNRMTPITVISDYVDVRFRDGFNVASFVDPQFGG